MSTRDAKKGRRSGRDRLFTFIERQTDSVYGRLHAGRTEHLDQSLALVELTAKGAVGDIPRRI
jgi:hypothetical protein